MGAWGTGSFEEDQVLDFLGDLAETDDAGLLEEALRQDFDALDVGIATEVIAAAEVVAALLGRPSAHLPGSTAAWVDDHRDLPVRDLAPIAIALLDRVVSSDSELNELWSEDPESHAAWRAGMLDLQGRLRA